MNAGGKVVVVTGGASGFGLAMARTAAAEGMAVVLADLDGERAQHEAAALGAAHDRPVLGMRVDVADARSVDDAASAVADRFGRADVVLSNVGVQLFGPVEGITDDEWRWVLDVNLVGSARVARAFLPLLRESSAGRIAFTTSSSVLDPASRLGVYQASKFAVWGLAESLRLEVADEGIGVTVIFPSAMISRHLETSEAAQPAHLRRPIAAEEDFTRMAASNPGMVAAVATPEEAAGGVLDAVLAGDRYVVTHGDLVAAVAARCAELHAAAETARHG